MDVSCLLISFLIPFSILSRCSIHFINMMKIQIGYKLNLLDPWYKKFPDYFINNFTGYLLFKSRVNRTILNKLRVY